MSFFLNALRCEVLDCFSKKMKGEAGGKSYEGDSRDSSCDNSALPFTDIVPSNSPLHAISLQILGFSVKAWPNLVFFAHTRERALSVSLCLSLSVLSNLR